MGLEMVRFAFDAVFPLFTVLLVGMAMRRANWLNENAVNALTRINFQLLIPVNLFKATYFSDLHNVTQWSFLLFGALSFLGGALVLGFIVPRFVKSRVRAGTIIHTSFRSNTVQFGIPLATNLFGEAGALMITLMIAVVAPLVNILGVTLLTVFGGEEDAAPPRVRDVLIATFTNKLVVASLLGILLSLLSVPLPAFVSRPVVDIAAASLPLSLLALGARFDAKLAFRNLPVTLAASALKLVVMPAAVTAAAVAFGFHGTELGVIYVVHAVPTAATCAILADSMGGEGALTGEIMVMTNLLASITLFCGAMLLKTLGLV